MRAAEITMRDVRVEAAQVIWSSGRAAPVIARVADEAVADFCAEAIGCLAEMQVITVAYLKTLRQFGATIGSFQVLQHRAVDMFVELEQSRPMAMYATMIAGADDPTARERAISAAKAQIGQSAKTIGCRSIQLHGGVGVTMEYRSGHYFKRVTMIDTLFGDASHQLRRHAALRGLVHEEHE